MDKSEKSPAILMIGPLPPPFGGQSILINTILEGELSKTFNFLILNVSHGSLSIVKRAILAIYFAVRLLVLLVKNPEIRLLHIHTSAGMAFFEKSLFVIVGKLFGKKVILHMHGGQFPEFWEHAAGWKKRLIRRLLNLNDLLIVLGQGWSAFYAGKVQCSCKIAVLVNATKVVSVVPPLRSKLVTFLFVGQLRPEKGVLDLLHAVQSMPESTRNSICLKLMGGGDTDVNEKLVRAAYAEADLPCVEFLGWAEGGAKWREFSSADVFVLPSHSEDMPITILEAMGMGLPVISTDVGCISSMVQDGVNGYLVKPHDVAALAGKMQHITKNPDLRVAMGQAGKQKYVGCFSFEKYEEKLESLYRALIN